MKAVINNTWKLELVKRSELDLAKVLPGGQSFRWKLYKNSEWRGVFGHCLWRIRQNDDETISYIAHQKKSAKILEDQESSKLFKEYFQLDVSIDKLYKEWVENDPNIASLRKEATHGIRVLKQDPVETIFAFICSSNNNITRISQMIAKLCKFYGEKIIELDGEDYYDFPEVQKLTGTDVEDKLRKEAFGYRANYIAKTAQLIIKKGGNDWVTNLRNIGYQNALEQLRSLVGVGRKVADCICLMGLGYNEAIPVDTHIFKVGKEYLPHLKNTKTVTDKVYSEITDHLRGLHGKYAGWAQSILFTSQLKNGIPIKKETSKEHENLSKHVNKTRKRKLTE